MTFRIILFTLAVLLPNLSFAQTAPDVVFKVISKAHTTYIHNQSWLTSGSWNQSVIYPHSTITRTATAEGSVSGNTVTLTSTSDQSGNPKFTNSRLTTDQYVEVWVQGLGNADISVTESANGSVSSGYGNREAAFSQVDTPSGAVTADLSNPSFTHSASNTTNYLGSCGSSGLRSTTSIPGYEGVTYYAPLGYGYIRSRAYTKTYGNLTQSSTSTGTMTVSVSLNRVDPVAQGTSPSAVNDTVSISNLSYDPDNNGGGAPLDGICYTRWTVVAPDGQSTDYFSSDLSFTADINGTYSITLYVEDNEEDSALETFTYTHDEDREREPGEDDKRHPCDEKGYVSSNGKGNAGIRFPDPVKTRSYPLSVDLAINSQTNFVIPRDTIFGNASFSYGIEFTSASVYTDTGTETRWILVDGDGAEWDFGPATGSPSAEPGFFATLSSTGSGYLLSNAGPIGQIQKAGNFEYEFDTNGKLLKVTDPQGNEKSVSYNGSGDVDEILDVASDKWIKFEYDTPGLVARIVENEEGAIRFLTYTSVSGRDLLSGVSLAPSRTAPTERVFTVSYDAEGYPTKLAKDSDPDADVTITYEVGGDNLKLANVSWLGGATNIDYFALPTTTGAKLRHVMTNAQGGETSYEYDEEGNLIAVTYPKPQGASVNPVHTYGYDSNKNKTSFSDGLVSQTWSYDSLGNVTQFNNGAGGVWNYTYNGVDILTASDSIDTITYVYGDTANPHMPTSITDGSSATWTYTYNAYGQPLTISAPSGSPTGTVTITYDETASSPTYGYPLSVTNGAGDLITYDSYNELGDVTSISTYPATGVTNTTTYEYDAQQRLSKVTHPDGKYRILNYTGRDLTALTDESGRLHQYEYCAGCGALKKYTGPLGKVLEWNYDSDSNLVSFEDARNNVNTFTRDDAERAKEITFPDSQDYDFSYNNNLRLSLFDLATGRTASYSYDAAGRVDTIDFSNAVEDDIYFSYYADGEISQVIDGAATTDYAYDGAKRVTGIDYDFSANGLTPLQEVDATYYPDGLLHTLTWKSGGSTVASWTYSYDAAGRTTSVVNSFGETTSSTYDNEGKVLTQTNANGTVLSYVYNEARDWPTNITYTSGGTTFASYSLTYDSGANTVGYLTGVTEYGGTTESYTYDDLDRLLSEVRSGSYSHAYAYDLANNVTDVDGSSFATYDSANKISSLVGGSLSNDSSGRISNFNHSVIGSGTFYWDTRSKLTAQTTSVGNSQYKYDYRGLRLASYQAAESQWVYYVFFGEQLIGEIRASGDTTAYTYGAEGLVSQRDITGAVSRWYHFGPQGETRELTDNSGVVTDTYEYSAYGSLKSSSGSSYNPFMYGAKYGYYSDGAGAGLILAGQRWYQPGLMRWISRDPILFDGGDNVYSYVGGSPVGFVDPDGLEAEHTTNQQPSNRNKHEQGQTRKKIDRGGEKGDIKRRGPRKRPPGWKGPWPPNRIPCLYPFLFIPVEECVIKFDCKEVL